MKKFWKYSWIYNTYSTIRSYIEYRKERSYIKKVFYSDEFKLLLKQYLNLDAKKDWLGRIYGIINPSINNEGFFDISNSIIELNGEYTNNNDWVQFWVYQQLDLIKHLFKLNKLYDYISIDIQKVGPISFDNYLIVFDIASRIEFTNSLKRWTKVSIFYIMVIAIITLTILYIIL